MVKKSNKPSKFSRLVIYPVVGIFFIFLLVYVLTLASGYKLFIDKGLVSFQKTGMIIVSSKPADAKIYLDGKYANSKTTLPFLSVRIADVKPGKHTIAIEKIGYQTWSKTILVKANMVSWANYTLLFPNSIKSSEISDLEDLKLLSVSDNKRYFLYSKISAKNETLLYQYDVNNDNFKSIWPIANKTLTEAWLQNPQIISANLNNNSKVFLKLKNNASEETVILDFSKTEPAYSYRFDPSKYPMTKTEWNPKNQNELISTMSGSLYRLVLENNGQISQNLLDKNIVDFSVDSSGTIFYVQDLTAGYVVARIQPDGSGKNNIAESVEKSKSYQFAYSRQKNYLALLPNDTKNLTAYYQANGAKTSLQLDQKILGIEWNKDGTRLAYFDGELAKVYDFEKMEEKTVDIGTKINMITWYYDESHLLVQGETGLFVVEYDGFNKTELASKANQVSVFNQSSVFYSTLKGNVKSYYKINLNF
ncbi:MAG: PEGA domain-containing protein [Patescibacteria group bacterium]|jgi:hypothetical protein|nr:PEGA domain-containing protein [Patescibacteria group bacterium]